MDTPSEGSGRAVVDPRAVEGERKQVTVLFADIADFTSMSETMDPEELHGLIAPCLEIMRQEIDRYDGTITQFLGDGLMALFGAPLSYEDAPRRAIHAALAIQERLSASSSGLAGRKVSLAARIGLNSGLVVVGSIGRDHAMEYTAIGDTVNLASRIENTAEPGTVRVSESTYRLAKEHFEFEDLGEIRVKGKRNPVRTYRPIAPRVQAPLSSGLSPFVGRARELGILTECFADVSGGRGRVIGIMGEPGVGKSRLVRQFRQSLPPESFTYLEGGCFHYGDSIPYLPVRDMLRDYFGVLESDSEAASREKVDVRLSELDPALATLFQPLLEMLSLSPDDDAYTSLEPQARRQMVFGAIRDLLLEISEVSPLVMVVEDLHWIDRTTSEFLGGFVDSLADSAVMLVLLYRPEFDPPWTGAACWTQLSLSQLERDASADLVSAILGAKAAPGLAELIVTKTAGNPLFIEELTQALYESGALRRDNGHFALSAEYSPDLIPGTVQSVIASRLDRLEDSSKRTMQVASVIGREFAFRLLQKTTAVQEDLKELLERLESLEFIYEKALFPELEYIFKHALTQEVAYNSLLVRNRKSIHETIGLAIESLYADGLADFYEILAHHYSRSDNAAKAVEYLRLAGKKAEMAYSCWEAIAFYDRAIEILDTLPRTQENQRVKMEVCAAILAPMIIVGTLIERVDLFQEAERLADEYGDEGDLALAMSRWSYFHTIAGNIQEAVEYGERCFDLAESVGSIELMSSSVPALCTARGHAADYLELADVGRRFQKKVEEMGVQREIRNLAPLDPYSEVSGYLGYACVYLGRFEEAEESLRKGLENAIAIDDIYEIGWNNGVWNHLACWQGDGNKAIETMEVALEHWEKLGMLFQSGYSLCWVGQGHYILGEYEEALDCAQEGLEMHLELGMPALLPGCYWNLALDQLALGDIESAEQNSRQALTLSRDMGAKTWEILGLTLSGRIIGEADPAGRLGEAEDKILAGVAMADERSLRPFAAQGRLFLGEVRSLAGRNDGAREALESAEAACADIGMSYWLQRARDGLAAL